MLFCVEVDFALTDVHYSAHYFPEFQLLCVICKRNAVEMGVISCEGDLRM
jgi:hypothetical protein